MNLLILEDNKIKVSVDSMLIPHFKLIWDRDTSKSKENAIKELSYIYFIADYKSVYLSYPESIREKTIISDIIKDETWKPDNVIKSAITKYEELQETPTLRMLKGARVAQEAVTEYYQGLKNDKDRVNGKTVNTIAQSLERMGKIAESIDKLEEKIRREVQKEGKSKANRQINYFEE